MKIKNVSGWAIEFSKNANHIPLRHQFGIFSIAKIIEDILLNDKLMNKKK